MGAKSVGHRWQVLAGDLPGRDEVTANVQLGSDDYEGWLFTLEFDDGGAVVGFGVRADTLENRQGVIHGAELPAAVDPAPLNARFVHDLPFGEIVTAARVYLADWSSELSSGDDRHDMAARRLHFAAVLRERPGRRGRTDLEYAQVARAYVELVADGYTAPVAELAERFVFAESTVRNQLSEARRRGLLTATKAGLAGGRLTAGAKRLLGEADDGTR